MKLIYGPSTGQHLLPVFARVPEITQQGKINALVTHSFCYSLKELITHRQAQRQDVQNSPNSAQDLQRAVYFDAILPVWRELAFLAAAVTSTQMSEDLVSFLIQIPQFRTWALSSDSGKWDPVQYWIIRYNARTWLRFLSWRGLGTAT